MGTQQEDSSKTAMCHEADGRRGDICFQGISRPCEAHKSRTIGVFNFRTVISMGNDMLYMYIYIILVIYGQVIYVVRLVPDHIL